MIGEPVPLRKRVFRTILLTVMNLVFWVLIPSYLGSILAQSSQGVPLGSTSFVYGFGLPITAVQALASLTQGMAVSVPLTSGGYLAEAYFIWAATNGGSLQVDASGLKMVLGFAPLVFLLALPALFGAIRAPIMFLLEQSEVARPFRDEL